MKNIFKIIKISKPLHPIAYLIAETVWLITFVTHSAGRSTSGDLLLADPDQVLADVKRNTDSVKEILKR